MEEPRQALEPLEPTARSPRRGRRSVVLLWLVLLLLAIVSGSSEITVDIAGKSAPLYWTDLWVLLLYPLYILWVERGRFPRPRGLLLLIALSLGWELLGLPRSVDPLRGLRLFAIHAVGLVIYFFAARVRLKRGDAHVLVRLLALAPLVMLALAWASIGQAGSLGAAASSRAIESAIGRSNALATLFGAFGVFALGVWAAVPRQRALAAVGTAAAALGLLLTESRAGILAAAAGTLVLFLWLGGRGRRAAALVVLGTTLVAVLLLREAGVTAGLEARLARPKSLGEGPIQNVLIRLDYWRVSLEMCRASPLLGQGLGSFEAHYQAAGRFTIDRPTDPHNQVFLLLGETGVPGAGLAMVLAFVLVARAWPRRGEPRGRLVRGIVVAAVAVAAMHSQAEPVFRNPSSVALVALLLGLGANPRFYAALEPEPLVREAPLAEELPPASGP